MPWTLENCSFLTRAPSGDLLVIECNGEWLLKNPVF